MLFLNLSCDFQFFLIICSTHFTSHWPKCFFHMNNHKNPAGWVIPVERISRWTKPWGNINKKTQEKKNQGLSHFRQLLENLGLKEMSDFPRCPIYSVKNLRSTALFEKNFHLHPRIIFYKNVQSWLKKVISFFFMFKIWASVDWI